MKRTASDQEKVETARKPRWVTVESGSNENKNRENVYQSEVEWRSRNIRGVDRIWALLCEAQHLAPDNVTINLQLLNCWPEHLPYCKLVDAITQAPRYMSRESLLTYIVELDAELIEPLMHMLDQMEEGEVRLVRVRTSSAEGSLCWGAQWMNKRDLLVRLLANQPRCAKGYRMLAETLTNPFERILIESDLGVSGFNRMQLHERAELLDPSY